MVLRRRSPCVPRPLVRQSRVRAALVRAALVLGAGVAAIPVASESQQTRGDTTGRQVSLRVASAVSVAGFESHVDFAGGQRLTSHYRVRPTIAVGLGASMLRDRRIGVRVDADALVLRLADRTNGRALAGTSVAALTAVSATAAPRALCRARCLQLSLGIGVGYFNLGEHEPHTRSFAIERGIRASATNDAQMQGIHGTANVRPIASSGMDVVSPVGSRNFPFAVRGGVQYGIPTRSGTVLVSLTDHVVKFNPERLGPGISPMHLLMLGVGITTR